MNRFFAVTAAVVLSASITVSAAVAGGSGKKAEKIRSGHYQGTSSSGRSISFDVVRSDGRLRVQNLAADVDTECWSDIDHDGNSDTLLAHVSGLSGKVSRAGEVDVYFAPDDDTEYVVQGNIKKGLAKLNVIVGGSWDHAGMPSPAGPFQCDNWGARYQASRR